ncbi:iron-sulfur cluster insertion protein ErpA [Stella sp.]|uniref:iron-sulfur cluster insertion protein ErpA n=1 Tax=Stella sp. TaxID=2912054 RepID=UPI0035B0001C
MPEGSNLIDADPIDGRRMTLTENAARRIRELQEQDEFRGMFLRVSVSGGGCSGFQYGFSFDDQRTADDHEFTAHGVSVVVDDTSLDLLNGAALDYVEEMVGASFRMTNPNASSSCGCGSSFAI